MANDKTYTTRGIGALGGAASLWLLINAVSDSLEALACGLELYLMGRAPAGTQLDAFGGFEDPDGLMLVTGLARLPMLAITLITGFVVLKWVYRANRNARAFGRGLSNTPPWAVGWFFVPIASLWKPFQAMEEMWRVSQNPEGWKRLAVPPLLRWWWGFWLVGTIAGNLAMRIGVSPRTFEALQIGTVLELVSAMAFVAAGLALRRVIEVTTERQTHQINARVF